MKRSDFDFLLPPELIAQAPARPRDSARLLVYDRTTGDTVHRVFRDLPEYLRPADVHELRGDASKAKRKLGWEPKTSFEGLVREMLENDLKLEGVELSLPAGERGAS